MNKKTKALTTEQYTEIIQTMKCGFGYTIVGKMVDAVLAVRKEDKGGKQ